MLKFFPHPEGYVEFKNNQYLYTYQYKDHLGNVRLTYRDGYRNHPTLEYAKDGVIQVTEIIEENNYSAGLPTSLPVSVSGSVNETKSIWKSK